MALNISSGALTAVVGLLGVLIGTLIGPYINHKLSIKNTRKDFIFKKKLEYFEKITDNIEKNIRLYRNAINEALSKRKKSTFKKIHKQLRANRKNFLIASSPLYFNTRNLSQKIISFVNLEKNIFEKFENLPKLDSKESIKNTLEDLEETLNKLKSSGNAVIIEMKKELHKY